MKFLVQTSTSVQLTHLMCPAGMKSRDTEAQTLDMLMKALETPVAGPSYRQRPERAKPHLGPENCRERVVMLRDLLSG